MFLIVFFILLIFNFIVGIFFLFFIWMVVFVIVVVWFFICLILLVVFKMVIMVCKFCDIGCWSVIIFNDFFFNFVLKLLSVILFFIIFLVNF